jgi:hypothetical protein
MARWRGSCLRRSARKRPRQDCVVLAALPRQRHGDAPQRRQQFVAQALARGRIAARGGAIRVPWPRQRASAAHAGTTARAWPPVSSGRVPAAKLDAAPVVAGAASRRGPFFLASAFFDVAGGGWARWARPSRGTHISAPRAERASVPVLHARARSRASGATAVPAAGVTAAQRSASRAERKAGRRARATWLAPSAAPASHRTALAPLRARAAPARRCRPLGDGGAHARTAMSDRRRGQRRVPAQHPCCCVFARAPRFVLTCVRPRSLQCAPGATDIRRSLTVRRGPPDTGATPSPARARTLPRFWRPFRRVSAARSLLPLTRPTPDARRKLRGCRGTWTKTRSAAAAAAARPGAAPRARAPSSAHAPAPAAALAAPAALAARRRACTPKRRSCTTARRRRRRTR